MGIFKELTTSKEHSRSKQNADINSSVSENLTLVVVFDRYVAMRTLWYIVIVLTMHIVEQEMVTKIESVQHNTKLINTLLYTRKPYSYFQF